LTASSNVIVSKSFSGREKQVQDQQTREFLAAHSRRDVHRGAATAGGSAKESGCIASFRDICVVADPDGLAFQTGMFIDFGNPVSDTLPGP
jgi:hypothetical protein